MHIQSNSKINKLIGAKQTIPFTRDESIGMLYINDIELNLSKIDPGIDSKYSSYTLNGDTECNC